MLSRSAARRIRRGHAVARHARSILVLLNVPLAGLALVSFAPMAGADTSAPAEQLDAVVVTATRGARSPEQLPVATSVLRREDVEATPYQSIDDLLRTVAGVNLPFADALIQHPTSNAVATRGLGGIRTLVLLDGIPLNDPFFGFPLWNAVPKETLDRVEVVRGGASNLYGNFALGGVINLITRAPDQPEAEVSGGWGSYGTTRADGYLGGPVSERFSLAGNASHFRSNGYIRPVASQRGAIDTNANTESSNFQLGGRYRASDATNSWFRANVYDNQASTGTPLSNNGQKIYSLALGANRQFDAHQELRATLFGNVDHSKTDNTTPTDPAQPHDTEYLSNIHDTPADDVGGSLIWSGNWNGWFRHALAGVDARWTYGRDSTVITDAPGATPRLDRGSGTQESAGAFVQASLFPIEKLEVVLGGREDIYLTRNVLDIRPGHDGRLAGKTSNAFSPKLALAYQLAPGLSARASVYEAFHAPNLDQLYRTYTANGFGGFPNPQLTPERLFGQEAGIEWRRRDLHVQATVYHDTVRNLIGSVVIDPPPAGLFFAVQNANIGKVRTQGLELEGDWRFAPHWRLAAEYTYTDATTLSNPGDPTTEHRQNADIPRNQASLGLNYGGAQRPSAGLRFRWVDRRPDPNAYPALSRNLGAFTVLDASASLPLPVVLPHTEGAEVYAIGENILNRRYIADTFGADLRGTPAQLFVGLRLRFR